MFSRGGLQQFQLPKKHVFQWVHPLSWSYSAGEEQHLYIILWYLKYILNCWLNVELNGPVENKWLYGCRRAVWVSYFTHVACSVGLWGGLLPAGEDRSAAGYPAGSCGNGKGTQNVGLPHQHVRSLLTGIPGEETHTEQLWKCREYLHIGLKILNFIRLELKRCLIKPYKVPYVMFCYNLFAVSNLHQISTEFQWVSLFPKYHFLTA